MCKGGEAAVVTLANIDQGNACMGSVTAPLVVGWPISMVEEGYFWYIVSGYLARENIFSDVQLEVLLTVDVLLTVCQK